MEGFNHLIRIAKKNLADAAGLYSKQFYFHSVCALQQSVEKANLAFALKNNIISATEKELMVEKPVNSLRAFMKKMLISDFINAKEGYEMLAELLFVSKLNLPEHQSLRKDLVSGEIVLPQETFDHLRALPESDLDDLIVIVNEMGKITIPEFNEVKALFISKAKSIILSIDSENQNNDEAIKLEIESTLNTESKLLELAEVIYNFTYSPGFRKLGEGIFGLICLALIMQPHANERQKYYYGSYLSPGEFYNNSLPLIKKMPDLLAIQKMNIEFLEIDKFSFKVN